MLRSWRRLGLLKNEAEPCDFLHISVPSRFQNQDELRLGATFFPCPMGHAAGAPGRVQKWVQGLPPRTPLIGVPGRWPGRPGVFALAERRRALAMGRLRPVVFRHADGIGFDHWVSVDGKLPEPVQGDEVGWRQTAWHDQVQTVRKAAVWLGLALALSMAVSPAAAREPRQVPWPATPMDGGQTKASEAARLPVVSLDVLPQQARKVHQLILTGGPFPYEKDGVVFGNRERILPRAERGYYREYTVAAPRAKNRGPKRIVCGGTRPTNPDHCYYTDDHYASFRRIVAGG